MKQITIGDKNYNISSNAYSRFQYKQVFNKKLFSDISQLNKITSKESKLEQELKEKGLNEEDIKDEINSYWLENMDDFVDIVLRLAYIFILSANPQFETFENWLKGIESIKIDDSWIGEVTELAVNSFHG